MCVFFFYLNVQTAGRTASPQQDVLGQPEGVHAKRSYAVKSQVSTNRRGEGGSFTEESDFLWARGKKIRYFFQLSLLLRPTLSRLLYETQRPYFDVTRCRREEMRKRTARRSTIVASRSRHDPFVFRRPGREGLLNFQQLFDDGTTTRARANAANVSYVNDAKTQPTRIRPIRKTRTTRIRVCSRHCRFDTRRSTFSGVTIRFWSDGGARREPY